MLRALPKSIPKLNSLAKPSSFLPLLLKATEGDVASAVNELRWLQEHVDQLYPSKDEQARKQALLELCQRREKFEPLQYILGTQPFGGLEIKCKKGVLIPRPETEAYTIHLAQLLCSQTFSKVLKKQFASSAVTSKEGSQSSVQDQASTLSPEEPKASKSFVTSLPHDSQHTISSNHPLRTPSDDDNSNLSTLNILDICSGSGCISLLLHSLLFKKFPNLNIRGWDISRTACTLANQSLRHNIEKGFLSSKAREQVQFHQRANVFNPRPAISKKLDDVDIIISNPPYISADKLLTEATQSVREWEPLRALVPPLEQRLDHDQYWTDQAGQVQSEDVFYAQLLYLHGRRRRCRALIMEIGDQEQAIRVVKMALKAISIATNNHIEIWRDFPDQEPESDESFSILIETQRIPVVGAGSMRTVVLVLRDAESDLSKVNELPRTKDDLRGEIRAKESNKSKQDPIKKLIERQLKPIRKKRMV